MECRDNGHVTCKLQFRNLGPADVATAQLECSGGNVSAYAADHLRQKLEASAKGVSWDPKACGAQNCLLTVCGSGPVTFISSIVSNVSTDMAALCFSGSTQAILSGITMTRNTGPHGLLISGQASVTITNSVIEKNSYLHAVYATDEAYLWITGETVMAEQHATVLAADGTNDLTITMKKRLNHNMMGISGAAVAAGGRAKVLIDDQTSFSGNKVINGAGGAIAAWDDATVNITGRASLKNNTATSFGGALAVMGRARVYITGDVLFEENQSMKSVCGAILVADSAVLSVSNGVVFRGNKALERNCGGVGAWGDAKVYIAGSVLFLGNMAVADSADGGAIVAAGNSLVNIINGVKFRENYARNTGGAIAVGGNATLLVHNGVLFEANSGTYGGGAIAAWDNNTVTVTRSVTFNGNLAMEGSGGAVSAGDRANITITEGCTLKGNNASRGGGLNMAGNSTLLLKVNILLMDNYALSTGGAINAEGESDIKTLQNITFQNNTAGSAGSDVLAESGCKLNLSGAQNSSKSNVVWYRKDCFIGEVLVTDSCESCAPPTYSLDPNAGQCNKCPVNAKCTGGDAIIPLDGHWHSHPYSTQVHPCPRKGMCKYNNGCSEGHTGHLCASCEPGFGSYGSFRCGRCLTPGRTLAAYLSAVFVLFLVASLLVQTTLKDNQLGAVSVAVRPSDIAKILVRHVQYLAIISTMSIQWPPALSAVFAASGWLFAAGSGEVVSLDCYLSSKEVHVSRAVAKSVIYLLAPVGVFLAVLCARFVWKRFARFLDRLGPLLKLQIPMVALESMASTLSVSFLVVLFFFYPFLVRVALGMFACLPLDVVGPGSNDPYPQYAVANATAGYWVSDMSQACYQGWHRVWALALGVPATLIFCVGVPLGMGALLFSNRAKLHTEGVIKECIGFLYHNYRQKRYYWEVVSIIQTAVLAAISVFAFSLGTFYAIVLLHACFAMVFVLQYIFEPYAMKLLNNTTLLSAGCLYATASIALTLHQGDKVAPAAFGDVIGVFGLVMNVAFILWCCFLLVKHSAGIVAQLLKGAKKCCLGCRGCVGCGKGEVKERSELPLAGPMAQGRPEEN